MSRNRLLILAAIIAPWLWIFGGSLFSDTTFVYRDAAHYYYPLFQWSTDQWQQGQLPFWNPHENLGVPLVGDATASLFYPVKLLLLLPLPFVTLYKCYITLHVLIAAATAFLLARHWKADEYGACVGAICYAFGGYVVFQYCNVIYLVGAAWLPLALFAGDRLLISGNWRWTVPLSAAVALIVLGGDPQTAYHIGIALAVLLIVRRRCDYLKNRDSTAEDESAIKPPVFRTQCLQLITAALVAAGLAAIQILPSIAWARQSDRYAFDKPRSVYEVPATLSRSIPNSSYTVRDGLLGHAAPGHHLDIYKFSLPPWHLSEYLWPNVSGRPFPTHRRWTDGIPEDGGFWIPTLYLGIIPLLIALRTLGLRSQSTSRRFLSWLLLISILSSFGWYGVGWIIIKIQQLAGGTPTTGNSFGYPVGGLYWLYVTLLPSYAYFRYPAKWLLFAQLAISMLAAIGWNEVLRQPSVLFRRVLWGLSIFSAVMGLIAFACWLSPPAWLNRISPNPMFGPFDNNGAMVDLMTALFHTSLICGLARVGCLLQGQLKRFQLVKWAMILTSIDVAVSNGWLMRSTPVDNIRQTSQVAERIQSDNATATPIRVHRGTEAGWWPDSWPKTSSTDRQSEVLGWDVNTLRAKYHMTNDPTGQIQLLESHGSMMPADLRELIYIGRYRGFLRSDRTPEPNTHMLSYLSVQYVLLPRDSQLPAGSGSPVSLDDPPDDLTVLKLQNPQPPAWIVHQVATIAPADRRWPNALREHASNVFFPDNTVRPLSGVGVVELPAGEEHPKSEATADISQESCQVISYGPTRVELAVSMTAAGLVVMSDRFDPGWTAQIQSTQDGSSKTAKIWRTNMVMRGIFMPAGNHRLILQYRPRTVGWGLLLSCLSLLGVILAFMPWQMQAKVDDESSQQEQPSNVPENMQSDST